MSAHNVQNQLKSNLADQLIKFALENQEEFENLQFGKLEFEVRDGSIYKVLVSNSILVKGKGNEAK